MFIILMTTQVIVFCLMLFVYLRSRLHGGSDKYLNKLVFCFIIRGTDYHAIASSPIME
ncbi:hypothetical protein [Providencia rettgeri]|uniref:hypothetical protein n=1 Tax=Providencia rettgeri TaxID=587 RepID=UPI0013A578E3